MKLYEVGVDIDEEFTCFAQCTTKEKAEKAVQLLIDSWEDLYIRESNLYIDEIKINDKIYKL